MYAVIKTGGKQYRVAQDDVLKIEKIDGEAGDKIDFDQVLMIGSDGSTTFGEPIISGAKVSAEIIEFGRHRKIIVFKKKRRKNYRRKNGHRQHFTTVKITAISGA